MKEYYHISFYFNIIIILFNYNSFWLNYYIQIQYIIQNHYNYWLINYALFIDY